MSEAVIYYEADSPKAPLEGKTIAVVGYGSQGHGHSQNMRDSGLNVIVAELEGTDNFKLAKEHGFEPKSAGEATKEADLVIITLPDEVQPIVYEKEIGPNLRAGQTLGFCHGFNIHFKKIIPPQDINVIMIAPKGPGHLVRSEFVKGGDDFQIIPYRRVEVYFARPGIDGGTIGHFSHVATRNLGKTGSPIRAARCHQGTDRSGQTIANKINTV